MYYAINNYELYHYGVLGMRWGVRRYQNPDGTLTPAGKRRQEALERRREKKLTRKAEHIERREIKKAIKRGGKIEKKAFKYASKRSKWEKKQVDKSVKRFGTESSVAVNAYNQKMASLMSDYASKYNKPNQIAIKFVARHEGMGVTMELSNRDAHIKSMVDAMMSKYAS